MDKPILHLIQPDTKFSDYIVGYFEAIHPSMNRYVALINISKQQDFSKTKFGDFIEVVSENREFFFELIGKWTDYKAVVCHAMSPFRASLIKEIPKTIKIGWTLFGYEFYNLFPEIKHQTYLEQSKKLLPSSLRYSFVNTIFYKKICKLIGKKHIANQLESGFRRVDVFGTLIKEEAELIKKTLNLSFDWKPFTFYNISGFLGKIDEKTKFSGVNILLGNSSSLTNNHLEALQFLSKQSLGDRKVITPLSYGNKDYGEKILKYGSSLLGNNFEPLTTFLSKEEYNTILLSCSIAIMNHIRQQALGNIISLLWFGTKVFLNEANPIYQYFIRIGVKVYSIQDDLHADFEKALESMEDKDIEYNRNIIIKIFSKEAVLEINKQFLNALIY